MLGTIVCDILLVLGCCTVATGLKRKEFEFYDTPVTLVFPFLVLGTTALVVPSILLASFPSPNAHLNGSDEIVSHGASIILILAFAAYTFFQLKSHAYNFDAEEQEDEVNNEEVEKPLAPAAALVSLTIVIVAIVFCAEYLIGSIDSITSRYLSKTFIDFILLPIAGNISGMVVSVIVAFEGKLELSLGISIGSSIQIALLVTPILVILGWIVGQPMTLHFDMFEAVTVMLSVLIVQSTLDNGKTNYLEGILFIAM